MKNLSDTRNFCIIAHINHGKSTLADRFLEITGVISKENVQPQFLDSMGLEREKGITIKLHPVRMNYTLHTTNYTLNLIDTPGHIDFSYETSRALACVEGAILLVDAIKGVQAQTLFNLDSAEKQGLKIIGVVNKIDIADQEQIDAAKKDLAILLRKDENEIFTISAKNGTNVKELLSTIIKEIPYPNPIGEDFKALIFDSQYDSFSGVVAFVRVFSGEVRKGEKLYLCAQNIELSDKEVGIFIPEEQACETLGTGQIGYIKTGIKEPSKVRVGDTLIKKELGSFEKEPSSLALKGYKEAQPVLYLSLYPMVSDKFEALKEALYKLKLNDPALVFQLESKMALGRGMRCGFLGSLHAEIAVRRLKEEFDLDLIMTTPQVVFKGTQEPWVELVIVSPRCWINKVLKTFETFKAVLKNTKVISSERIVLIAEAPLKNIISGTFYEQLKSSTKGYASFVFKPIGYREAELSKIDILVAGVEQESFSKIVDKEDAFFESKKILQKLKTLLPRQQFTVALQAAVGGKIIARETISSVRKDVTGALYGGDFTRKRKLLEKQKKGKSELKIKGRVNIPASVFLEMFKM